MDPIAKRKMRQRLQRATEEQFWNDMNIIHTQAYEMAIKHMTEAMACIPGITKKQQEAVTAKAEEIRETWDGLKTITIEDTEYNAIYGKIN